MGITTQQQLTRSGYKRTEVGVIPDDWNLADFDTIGSVIDGDRGTNYPSSEDFSNGGYCLFLNAGNVTKEGFRFAECAFISREKDARLNKGKLKRNDIVRTTRGTVGNVAYFDAAVPFENMRINSGMVILRNTSSLLDTTFLYGLLRSRLVQTQIERLSFGSAQPQLTVKDISKFGIVVPQFLEQGAIAEVLSDADEVVRMLDKLINKKRDIKTGTMQQLLTRKRRLPGFSGEWKVKKLGELLEYEQPTQYLVKDTEYNDDNDTPVLTAGKTFILGYTNEETGVFRNVPVIIFDDFTTASKYVKFPFKAKSSAMKILKPKDANTNLRVIFEKVQLIPFKAGEHKRYWISEYQHLEIEVAKPEEQTAIAAVLSDIDADIAALEARRDKARALKQGMMQQLLTGNIRLI